MTKVAASILSCNNAFLGDAVKRAEDAKADIIHIDIMDGHYVQNLSFGPKTVTDLKAITSLPVEVHLELENASEMIDVFAQAGADIIIIQYDQCPLPIRLLRRIRSLGKKAGIAVNPGVGIRQLKYFLGDIDVIVIMSVEPGFGGQAFEECTYEKVSEMKEILKEAGRDIPVAVDGGIDFSIADKLKKAGADILIVGSSLYAEDDIKRAVKMLKRQVV